jgi:hypothetical protein
MEKDCPVASNIQVAIRIRPTLEKEAANGEIEIVRVEDNLVVG